jgi:hypothetical protein
MEAIREPYPRQELFDMTLLRTLLRWIVNAIIKSADPFFVASVLSVARASPFSAAALVLAAFLPCRGQFVYLR